MGFMVSPWFEQSGIFPAASALWLTTKRQVWSRDIFESRKTFNQSSASAPDDTSPSVQASHPWTVAARREPQTTPHDATNWRVQRHACGCFRTLAHATEKSFPIFRTHWELMVSIGMDPKPGNRKAFKNLIFYSREIMVIDSIHSLPIDRSPTHVSGGWKDTENLKPYTRSAGKSHPDKASAQDALATAGDHGRAGSFTRPEKDGMGWAQNAYHQATNQTRRLFGQSPHVSNNQPSNNQPSNNQPSNNQPSNNQPTENSRYLHPMYSRLPFVSQQVMPSNSTSAGQQVGHPQQVDPSPVYELGHRVMNQARRFFNQPEHPPAYVVQQIARQRGQQNENFMQEMRSIYSETTFRQIPGVAAVIPHPNSVRFHPVPPPSRAPSYLSAVSSD